MEGRQEKPVDSKLLFTKLIYSNGYEVILFAQFNPNLSVSKDEATKRGLPVYQQLHAKTFTLIGGLVLQSWRQGAFGRVGWLVACLLAYLLGFFVGRGFRTLRVRWVEARLALVAVRYPGPLHVVLQSFEGKHELKFLHLVEHPRWIEIRPLDRLVRLRPAIMEQ